MRITPIIVILISLCIHKGNCLRCYECTDCGSRGSFNSEDADIIEECQGSCKKIILSGTTTRGCSTSVLSEKVCDAAPTITACYCKSDLCNSGSTFGVTISLLSVIFSTLRQFL